LSIAPATALHDHGHGIWLLDAGMYRDEMVAIHLIVHEGRVAVIDTATRHSQPRILAALEQLGDVIFRLPPRYQVPPSIAGLTVLVLIAASIYVLSRRVRGVEIVT